MSLEAQFLAGSSQLERHPQDFYRTPAPCTKELVYREQFDGLIWEPACGDGAISQVLLDEGYAVTSSDLHDRGFGNSGINFLESASRCDNIVTNPPYKIAQEFIEHALKQADKKVAMLLKLNFLEGQKRRVFFKKHPPTRIYVFSRRISFNRGDEDGNGAGLLAYAWYVWDIGSRSLPTLDWI